MTANINYIFYHVLVYDVHSVSNSQSEQENCKATYRLLFHIIRKFTGLHGSVT